MLFGKHINRYYLKHLPVLLLGILSLVVIDFLQLKVPELYRMVINGINEGYVQVGDAVRVFDMDLLLDEICLPMVFIIVTIVGAAVIIFLMLTFFSLLSDALSYFISLYREVFFRLN